MNNDINNQAVRLYIRATELANVCDAIVEFDVKTEEDSVKYKRTIHRDMVDATHELQIEIASMNAILNKIILK